MTGDRRVYFGSMRVVGGMHDPRDLGRRFFPVGVATTSRVEAARALGLTATELRLRWQYTPERKCSGARSRFLLQRPGVVFGWLKHHANDIEGAVPLQLVGGVLTGLPGGR